MKNNDKMVNTHKGMLICLWDAVAINNASVKRMITTGTHEKSDAIKNVLEKILSLPDYTFKNGREDRMKIDNETHIDIWYKHIFYKGTRLFTIYFSRTTGSGSLIDANLDMLTTKEEKAEIKRFNKNIDTWLQTIKPPQNKALES